ncbi:hypothetical protein [Actinomadura nitritigenes]|uniref:hypothetical protein n=1 Tax=Actinomadura nitritigenes TaxID=134602 RepID=UPI003D919BEF
MARSRGRTGRPYRRARAAVLATSSTCWICGHDGADQADHDPPLAVLEEMGLDPADPAFMHPAHGVNGCPTCGRKCNQSRGNRPHLPPSSTSRDW